jgi:hypothetical protein
MSVSRREFLTVALLLAVPGSPQSPGGSESGSESGSGSDAQSPQAPVVSFHLDRPYLDLTGVGKPYIPPAGMRSGAPLAALSEEEVLSRFYGFI